MLLLKIFHPIMDRSLYYLLSFLHRLTSQSYGAFPILEMRFLLFWLSLSLGSVVNICIDSTSKKVHMPDV